MPKGPLTVKIDAAMYDEIGLLRALVRDMSAFLDEWEWQLPAAPVNELQARARALGLSDTRDAVDTPSESNMWRGITNWVRAEE